MGIINGDEIIVWMERDGRVTCTEHGPESDQATPLTEDDFDEGDVVICDVCEKRILGPRIKGQDPQP